MQQEEVNNLVQQKNENPPEKTKNPKKYILFYQENQHPFCSMSF
jgi:hypothetical protein